MATGITLYPNYPVRFNLTDDDCIGYDNRSFCQLANLDDYLTFFWGGSYCESEVIVNGDFDNQTQFINNYGNTGFQWLNSSDYGYPGLKSITPWIGQKNINFHPANTLLGYYRFQITVKSQYQNNTVNGSCWVGINGIATTQSPITSIGEYQYFFNVQAGNTIDIFTDAEFDGIITGVSVMKLNTNYTIAIKEKADPTNIVYQTSSDYHMATPTQYSWTDKSIDLFWFSKKWRDIVPADPECYIICIYDGCSYDTTELLNSSITGSSGWLTSGSGWSFAGSWCHVEGATGTLYQNVPEIIDGNEYKVTLTATVTSGSVAVYFGTTLVGTITASGTYTYYSTGAAFPYLYFIASASFNGCITAASLTLSANSMTAAGCSECYNVRDSHACTKLITYWNIDDAFGVPWSVAQNDVFAPMAGGDARFKMYMRIESDLYRARYPEMQEIYRNSAGSKEVNYFDIKKQKELIVAELPEYMHDALAIARGHDKFYIESTRYVSTETYEPQWQEKPRLKMARVQFLVEEAEYKMINRKC